MGVIIKGFDKPKDCLGCPFLSKLEEASVGSEGLYKKIGFCKFASDIMPDLEDPWHDIKWLFTHTEDWCPITQINETTAPCNPSSDCISREALKDQFKGLFDLKYLPILQKKLLGIIDNAQAVETFTLEDMQNNFDLGAMAENGKHDTSKGKWIPMNPDCRGYSDYFKCSICGAYIYPRSAEKELDYNGCPYCFADMRGEEE